MSGLATSSHRFCIIGVRLRFPYCLMCEQQPEATQQCALCVWILYITYLTSPVAMLVREVHIKQTDADRHTSTYPRKCTLIGMLKCAVQYTLTHKHPFQGNRCRYRGDVRTSIAHLPFLSLQSSTSSFHFHRHLRTSTNANPVHCAHSSACSSLANTH